jgi:NAD(P)-dependent dehydrogenase (short-subunit alcohol dehydrogenase family)
MEEILMNLNLAGKVAIVTGSARGIGRATALTLATEGAIMVIDDIDLEAARLVEAEIKAAGHQAVAIRADVTKPEEVKHLVQQTLDMFGRINILVNNAGIWYIDGRSVEHRLFINATEDYWMGELGITLLGVLNCSRAVLETMLQQKSGSIVNIVSDAARAPRGGRTTAYGAGKGGIIAFTKNLAFEVGASGIRVNCISPGLIKTSQRAGAIESGEETREEVLKFWEDAQAMMSRAPIPRIGDPQDIANVVTFLVSDAASYVTGQTLSVNGGTFMA